MIGLHRRWVACLGSLGFITACAAAPGPTAPPEPAPPVESEYEAVEQEETPFDTNTYVSTHRNEDAEKEHEAAEAEKAENRRAEAETEDSGFAVATVEAAKQAAQDAVNDQLHPDHTWEASPLLPAQWPPQEPKVVVFFYPLKSNPPSLTEFRLFSPEFRVTVGLEDGQTEVKAITKSRKLATIKQTRATSLERRELDMAEAALMHQLLGHEVDEGAKPFWGYLKYVHEHDKIGRDLKRRSPKFFAWVGKHGR